MESKEALMGKERKTVKQGTGLTLEGKVGKEHEDDGQTDRVEPYATGHATMAQERDSEES